jgi:MoaA/NifB/PqqE/SkfB family radical SAM enzyme
MGIAAGLATAALVRLSEVTNRTLTLPLVVFFPTSRCNSRCVSCDWWRHSGEDDLTLAEIDDVARLLPGLGTKLVLFSGGEPLLRSDVFEAARLFLRRGQVLHLLTSGLHLERCAVEAGRTFARVIVSLDGSTEESYRAVRGVAGLGAVTKGVTSLRQAAPRVPVTARATLHRMNFRELPALIDRAREMPLDGISFLAADVTSAAFGGERTCAPRLALTIDEIAEFADLVEATIAARAEEFASGFVAESPDKLRRLPRYYAALAGLAPFPPVSCNAPWMSVVVEANGVVRPCFFHEPVGSVRRAPLDAIVARSLPGFRRGLDPASNPVCSRCVCSIRTGWRHAPWH